MKKTGQGGGELKRNRNRQQSKESDSILQSHQACMEQLQLQGTCIARFAILCYQSTSLVIVSAVKWRVWLNTTFLPPPQLQVPSSPLSQDPYNLASCRIQSFFKYSWKSYDHLQPSKKNNSAKRAELELFLFLRGRTCAHFLLRACAGRVTFLATFCFVYPPRTKQRCPVKQILRKRDKTLKTLGQEL